MCSLSSPFHTQEKLHRVNSLNILFLIPSRLVTEIGKIVLIFFSRDSEPLPSVDNFFHQVSVLGFLCADETCTQIQMPQLDVEHVFNTAFQRTIIALDLYGQKTSVFTVGNILYDAVVLFSRLCHGR